ncbi:uncharacterized protein LOC122529849 isoform X2 [Frieseomelitta varia]|uniref:uncharacterized protein LOC122529849 isoform X2 n=1 Tax=Frieseomelitta varia TaxID=561572 RepID=UPI001CB69AC1|nr:uncharacterized protein LOC122529849 isoform X2 [Frieseomelitta varia]
MDIICKLHNVLHTSVSINVTRCLLFLFHVLERMANLEVYKEQLQKIRQYARENGITENEIDKALQNSFRILEKKEKKVNLCFIVKSMFVILFIIIVCFISFDKKFLVVMLMRNLQNSIYPGLKLIRKIAIPVIQHYPSLSENFSDVRMKDIQELLWQNSEVFKTDAMKVFSNNKTYRNIQDVMEKNMDLNLSKNLYNHVTWRINRITAGRILRKLFPKPTDTPNWWEQSTEKFIFFDEPKSPPYSLPNPECSNIMIRCTTGTRLIKMIASSECSASCESFTVLLSAGKTLWYNWWYWRPVSFPALNSTTITISYMTSFC